jgi:RNA recognition motif-containing protein
MYGVLLYRLEISLVCRVMLLIHLVLLDDPTKDPQVRGDAFKTLFIARLSYDVKESDLEREFGRFGPIERVCK